ncbi:MAG TPA: nickel pincer cofactor biosynthesis protein LarC [Thermodesulfobacteriota bacterium]|nr:nickel pincer cofactor biosynthesis protein LarC [Thermodesulfobacteriota bacterium]
MRILYFDCPTGISGDMCLASLIDLGVSVEKLKKELKKLNLSGYEIKVTRENRGAVNGVRFKVRSSETHPHRTFKDIKNLIERSGLKKDVKELSVRIFTNLAKAEGKIHGISPLKVMFHEVGAIDSIVDIVGASIALNELDIDEVRASAIPTGSGFVDTMHGRLPVPAPATIEVLKGVPIVPSLIEMELTTPTGAVILKTVSKGFGKMPAMTVKNIGYGLGGKDFRETPNALRAVIGEADASKESSVIVIETNIDDMTPQTIGYLLERLIKQGALDAFITPVQMKKGRPGFLLTVLAGEKEKDKLTEIIFRESTAIGVRHYRAARTCLERKIARVKTPLGLVRVKVSTLGDEIINIQPEYEDCKKIAEKKKLPLREVMDEVKKKYCKK